MTHQLVILGAGYAGLAVAGRAARLLGPVDVRITLINAGDRFVERIRLHQLAAGQHLRDHPIRGLLTGTGVELLVGTVLSIDTAARQIEVLTTVVTEPVSVRYDTLVYAMGSTADVSAVPGAAVHAYAIADAHSAVRLRSRLAELVPGDTLAVVGGGLTGIEAAGELAESNPGLRVQLVSDAIPGGWLSHQAQQHVISGLHQLGIDIRSGSRVDRVLDTGLALACGEQIDADAVLWAAGFQVSGIAAAAGFAVDDRGRMLVDDTLRSRTHPDVYAVGDAAAAQVHDGITRMSCQTSLPMGQYVADAIAHRMAGRTPRPFRLRYVWQNISLGRRDAVTQFTHADDSPRQLILRGRCAALFKEAISRGVMVALRHPGPYWPVRGTRRRRAPQPSPDAVGSPSRRH